MAIGRVITSLQTKDEDGNFPQSLFHPIGGEARYIAPIRGSSVNNIEEQFLIGVDCITTVEKDTINDETVTKTIKEFRKDIVDPTNFYKMIIIDYDLDLVPRQYTDELPDGGAAGAGNVGTFIIDNSVVNGEETVDPVKIQETTLYFYRTKNDPSPVEVSKKTTFRQYINGKKIVKEIIENRLS